MLAECVVGRSESDRMAKHVVVCGVMGMLAGCVVGRSERNSMA